MVLRATALGCTYIATYAWITGEERNLEKRGGRIARAELWYRSGGQETMARAQRFPRKPLSCANQSRRAMPAPHYTRISDKQQNRRALSPAPFPMFRRLLFVRPNIDLPAPIDPGIPCVVGASVDRAAATAISHAASQAGTPRIDRRRARGHVQIRRCRPQIRKQRICIRRIAVFSAARLIRGIGRVVVLAAPVD